MIPLNIYLQEASTPAQAAGNDSVRRSMRATRSSAP